jgi:hypothetical protein
MKNIVLLFFILFFHSAFAQQTIDKLNVNQLKLPKESVDKATIVDGTGQVKSSSVTSTELGYLSGLSDTLTNLLSNKANDSEVVKLTGDQSVSGVKTFTGKIVASSTVNGSIPCPVMTEAQRNLTTPAVGDCVYNSTSLELNVYDGTQWKEAGGGGGISLWTTATPYVVDDVVIESDKIYRCIVAHTSGTFAADLLSGYWVEVSSGLQAPVSLANGGTNKNLTAVLGGVVWVDTDSFEILSPGISGQVLQSNGSASPSWVNKSISAKSEFNSSVTLEEIQVSNNQLTQTDTNKHLLESGNSNILANPSFEHSTVSTSWTSSAGTLAEDLSVVVNGKKSLSVTLSAQALAVTQDSTLYASQFADGVQGLASVRVKTSLSGIKVCSRQAGVTSTTNCVNVQGNGKWGLYKVPMILGATSNGISIHSNGTSLTGTVYLDDAFVGAVDLKQDVDARRLLGTITITGCSSNHGNSSTSFASLGTATGCSYVVTGSVLAPTTNVQGFRLSSIPVGSIEIIGIGSFGKSGTASNSDVAFQFRDLTNTKNGQDNFLSHVSAGGAAVVTPNVKGTLSYTTAASTSSFEIFGKTSNITSSGVNVFNFGPHNTNAQPTYYEIWYNGNNSTYSSTNADTDWASCGHTTSDFTGFGTVTNIETQCKREGSDLLMRGKFTSGPSTAVEARVNLKLGGLALTSAGTSSIPSLQVAQGRYASTTSITNSPNGSGNTLIEPSVNYLTFSGESTTGVSLTKQNASVIISNSSIMSFFARIPIAGWQNSNVVVAQISGLESCTDSYECTDTLSFSVSSAGIVSNENLDTVSGNCSVSDTSLYTCTYRNGLQGSGVNLSGPMNCTIAIDDVNSTDSSIAKLINTSSSTQLVFRTGYGSTPPLITKAAYATKVICQKQGVDYIGKTAKAVASDQNVRTPGVTNSVIRSSKVEIGGAPSNEQGEWITGSCALSSTANQTKTCTLSGFSTTPNCTLNAWAGTAGTVEIISKSSSSISYRTWSQAGTSVDYAVDIICHGVSL